MIGVNNRSANEQPRHNKTTKKETTSVTFYHCVAI